MNILNKNIISNSCVGAYIYKYYKYEFNHPFMWNIINYSDFNKLIDNYEYLNYNNIEIVKSNLLNGNYKIKEDWKNTFSIFIDKQVYVNYVHYIQDDLTNEIQKKDNNLYYCNIQNYIKDLYFKRLNRMTQNGLKEPIFIFNEFTTNPNQQEFIKLVYKPTKYKKIALVPHNYNINETNIPFNTFIIHLSNNIHDESAYAKYLINNYLNLLEL